MPPKRVLLTETHQTFLGVVRLILKDTGCTMLTAANELSLAEAAIGGRFDRVLADLSFPLFKYIQQNSWRDFFWREEKITQIR